MDMGGRERHRQRDPVSVDHKMALRARCAAIRRIRSGRFAPPGAGEARDQSILSASPSRSRSTWWSFFQTPACCQALSRRPHVIPLPQPISRGSISQGMSGTNKIPVSAFRPAMGGLPPPAWATEAEAGGQPVVHPRQFPWPFSLSPPRLLSRRQRFR
jgi:hypothetical protein